MTNIYIKLFILKLFVTALSPKTGFKAKAIAFFYIDF